ncbi:MAG: RdgB/HAM1 family non-canonical purine NTP pyrophosphatase [Azoarcus sp.]|jgi:XTP/dITP diphosphohydrolase|nr:RdgB/HAM1 family non-canonical purine NTP pyrophosphatase [Azoarcus sp.]
MTKKLVLASNNAKKAVELQTLLAPLGVEIVPQGKLGVTEAEEPYFTFLENALAKARHAAKSTGLPAIADDSGICVAALGGAPGVLSARFAGEPKSDERNNQYLLEKLANLPASQRGAWYYCCLVLVRHADDPCPLVADGEWHGEILTAPHGEGGFGYDPLFWLPQKNQSAAELPAEEKNAISHRGVAMRKLLERLREQPLE